MVIWLLDDPTLCVQSVVTDLRPLGLRDMWVGDELILSAFLPVRPLFQLEYDDKSRSTKRWLSRAGKTSQKPMISSVHIPQCIITNKYLPLTRSETCPRYCGTHDNNGL